MKRLIFAFYLFAFILNSCSGQIITTIAGNGCVGHDSGYNGLATAACIGYATCGSFDKNNNYYFAQNGGAVKVLKIDTSGIITVVAGNGTFGYYGDNGPATAAAIVWACAIVDSVGNIFIPDRDNHRVRKVDAVTGIIHTIAGNGLGGHSGDGGLATVATLLPVHACLDSYGNVYINDSGVWIRKISTTGIITTIAGNGYEGNSGDGGVATSAKIAVISMCIDANGDMLLGCNGYIRKIDIHTGVITSFAGNGTPGPYVGDGPAAAAQFIAYSLTSDRFNNIYVADYGVGNSRVLKIDTSGWVSTLAGTGIDGFSGDGGAATAAQLWNPEGVAVDKCGNIYVADDANRRIRKILINPMCTQLNIRDVNSKKLDINIYPNPVSDKLTIITTEKIKTIAITNILGLLCDVFEKTMHDNETILNIEHLSPGLYLVRVNDLWVGKFVKE